MKTKKFARRGWVVICDFQPFDKFEIGKIRPAVVVTDSCMALNPYNRMLTHLQVVPFSSERCSPRHRRWQLSAPWEQSRFLPMQVVSVSLDQVQTDVYRPNVTFSDMQRIDTILRRAINMQHDGKTEAVPRAVYEDAAPSSNRLLLVISTRQHQVHVIPLSDRLDDLDPECRLKQISVNNVQYVALLDQFSTISKHRLGKQIAVFSQKNKSFKAVQRGLLRQVGLMPRNSIYPLFDPVL